MNVKDAVTLSEDGTVTWRTIAVPEPVVPKSGFRCEWRQEDGKQLALASMPTPDRARRWAHIQMRVIASAINASPVGHVWHWLSDRWREPAEALKDGEEFTLPLSAGPNKFVWHARPMRFVPVVGGSPNYTWLRNAATGQCTDYGKGAQQVFDNAMSMPVVMGPCSAGGEGQLFRSTRGGASRAVHESR